MLHRAGEGAKPLAEIEDLVEEASITAFGSVLVSVFSAMVRTIFSVMLSADRQVCEQKARSHSAVV